MSFSFCLWLKNKVLNYLDINVNRDYIGLTITALVYRTIVGRVGTTSGCADEMLAYSM